MPAFLISGPFLSDLGLSLVALLFLINSTKNNLKKYFNNYFFKIFIFFCFLLTLSSLLSHNPLISLKTSFFYFRFGIFSICFWYLLDANPNLVKYLFLSILICFLSLIVDGYIQYFVGKNILGIKLYNEYRVSSFFGSELILGSYLARLFPLLFGIFIFLDQQKKNKLNLTFITIIFILSEGLIFLSGERLALFFMNLSAIFIIIMLKQYKVYRLWTYLISLLLILILMNMFPHTKERIIDQTFNDFRGIYKQNNNVDNNHYNNLYIFSKPHTHMYVTAYNMFLENKFFGVGPRQFRNKCQNYSVGEYSCDTHPHNTYLELLSEAGIFAFFVVFGFFCLLCFFSAKHFLFKFIKGKKSLITDFEVCLFSCVLISLWPFSPSGSFFNNWMSVVYYFPVGLLLWQRSKSKKSYKNPIN